MRRDAVLRLALVVALTSCAAACKQRKVCNDYVSVMTSDDWTVVSSAGSTSDFTLVSAKAETVQKRVGSIPDLDQVPEIRSSHADLGKVAKASHEVASASSKGDGAVVQKAKAGFDTALGDARSSRDIALHVCGE